MYILVLRMSQLSTLIHTWVPEPACQFQIHKSVSSNWKEGNPKFQVKFFYSCLNCKSKFLYQSHNKQNYETIRKQLPSQVYNLASSHKDHLEVQQLSTHWPCLKKRKIKKIWGGQPDEYLKYKKIGTSDYFQIQNKQNYMI